MPRNVPDEIEDNVLKQKMTRITVLLLIGFVVSLLAFALTDNTIVEVVTITVGVTLYHFAMRLAVGAAVNWAMQNHVNYKNIWFREKRFEARLYKWMQVRKWKKYIPTYDPGVFDASRKTVKEIVGATCQAEVVHEIIMVFSLLPVTLIPALGGGAALVITSVLSMLTDSVFVVLQRYNRPKLVRVMERFDRIK